MSDSLGRVTHRLDVSTVVRGAYVALVCGLTAYAVADVNNVRGPALAVALLLCLPATLLGLPFLYVILALAWNLTDADSGGTTWPVSVLYAVVLGGLAVVNLLMVERIRQQHTRGA